MFTSWEMDTIAFSMTWKYLSLERGTKVFRVGMDSSSGWDETDLEVDVNAFGRESET